MGDLFAVIAEPNRRLILDRLLESEASVTDLITVIGLSQTAMSKHLRVLRTHNLVTSRIDAQRRIYALNSEPLAELDDWLQGYRRTWNGHIDALAAHLDRKHSADPERTGLQSPAGSPDSGKNDGQPTPTPKARKTQ